MDCPTCGLTNPPGTSTCDCGYSFETGVAADAPGWPINLAWRQLVSAFWSIYWPAWLGSFLLLSLIPIVASAGVLNNHLTALGIAENLTLFGLQALLTRRLVRKNYRSFRVYVVRTDKQLDRKLSVRETAAVWFWIAWPQIAVYLLLSLVVGLWRGELAPEVVRGISSLSMWLRFLVVGPCAVALALRATYRGFSLQAYGLRYV